MGRTSMSILVLVVIVIVIIIIISGQGKIDKKDEEAAVNEIELELIDNREDLYETAIFAGGCFWCIEAAFETLDGVIDVVSGYTGGEEKDAVYSLVIRGNTGHFEAVSIKFNPLRTSYLSLLEVFFIQIDPTDPGGQFADRGDHYRTAVFYSSEEQRKIAENYITTLEELDIYDSDIVTLVLAAMPFYMAEEYHQDYAQNNRLRYEAYASGSGRKPYINRLWSGVETIGEILRGEKYKRPDDKKIMEMLDPLQYQVTQQKGTEKPFDNLYNSNKADGIYVDIVSGEPLFSSTDKYDSGTGWPSFIRPLAPENIVYHEDNSLFQKRIEVMSKYANSHLGHVFTDGPDQTGLRYCVNSAALLFIPKEELKDKGYSQYLYLFD